jgi:hypothetical protein
MRRRPALHQNRSRQRCRRDCFLPNSAILELGHSFPQLKTRAPELGQYRRRSGSRSNSNAHGHAARRIRDVVTGAWRMVY